MSPLRIIGLTVALLVPSACGAEDDGTPLAVSVASVQPAHSETRAHVDAVLASKSYGSARGSIRAVFDALAPHELTQTEASEIRRLEDGGYSATIIFDGVPSGDSVGGYRYDLTVRRDGNAWVLESLNHSWRCWPDRGHRDFSTEKCS